jgi:hypothetical protein
MKMTGCFLKPRMNPEGEFTLSAVLARVGGREILGVAAACEADCQLDVTLVLLVERLPGAVSEGCQYGLACTLSVEGVCTLGEPFFFCLLEERGSACGSGSDLFFSPVSIVLRGTTLFIM